MEENAPNQNPVSSPEVGFPHSQVNKPKSKTSLIIFIILGLLLIAGAVIFFVSRNRDQVEASPSPSDFLQESPTPFPTPSESASPSAKPADKAAVKVQILNGTGIPGEAAYLQGILKNLGYTNITAGNATGADTSETKIVFASTLSKDVQTEIQKKIESLYTTVTATTSSTQKSFDVIVTTGLRKGATAKPSTTASATATPRPSTSASPTASSTATPTPTASGTGN